MGTRARKIDCNYLSGSHAPAWEPDPVPLVIKKLSE
jgi:hypothetical protein